MLVTLCFHGLYCRANAFLRHIVQEVAYNLDDMVIQEAKVPASLRCRTEKYNPLILKFSAQKPITTAQKSSVYFPFALGTNIRH